MSRDAELRALVQDLLQAEMTKWSHAYPRDKEIAQLALTTFCTRLDRALLTRTEAAPIVALANALHALGCDGVETWTDAKMIEEGRRLVEAAPVADGVPLKVFSAGRWVYEGSPHSAEFDSTELDAAAFAAYRTHPQDASAVAELIEAAGELADLGPESVEFSDWPELQASVDRVNTALAAMSATKGEGL